MPTTSTSTRKTPTDKLCNVPIAPDRRCANKLPKGKPNCGEHGHEISAEMCGPCPFVIVDKNDVVHIWDSTIDQETCLIHRDVVLDVLYQLKGETSDESCLVGREVAVINTRGQIHRENAPAFYGANGDRAWYWEGKPHRDGGPAWVWPDGTQKWYQHGELHRDDGPAWIKSDGTQEWYQHDQLHRDNGPARIKPDGSEYWYQHGKLHRDGGPACSSYGVKSWWQHGQLHRDDGPADIWSNGEQRWYRHGKIHRDDGPAMIKPDGTEIWWKDGRMVPTPDSTKQ